MKSLLILQGKAVAIKLGFKKPFFKASLWKLDFWKAHFNFVNSPFFWKVEDKNLFIRILFNKLQTILKPKLIFERVLALEVKSKRLKQNRAKRSLVLKTLCWLKSKIFVFLEANLEHLLKRDRFSNCFVDSFWNQIKLRMKLKPLSF